MKGIAKVKYVFALELRDTGYEGFRLSTSEIIPTGQEAFCAISILAKHIVSNGIFCKPVHYLYYILYSISYFSI